MATLKKKLKIALQNTLVGAVLFVLLGTIPASGNEGEWQKVLNRAKGQTVYFNAWGGSDSINQYIAWVGKRVKEEYGITLKHVKVSDATEYILRVQADKAAGRNTGGGVDLVWINGENFKIMKERGLLSKVLYGPSAQRLPNYALVDVEGKPAVTLDFTTPTDDYESPWGSAQIVFVYDSKIISNPPKSAEALLAYAKQNPGRITYPKPPDFTGSTFLKQMLYELSDDISVFQKPPGANAGRLTAKLWNYLAEIRPHLWRRGKVFPKDETAMRQLLNDGEIDLSLTFSPGAPSLHVINGDLPETTKTYVLKKGTIGNAHFVAIPYNAKAREGGLVVANFLLSPEAQYEKKNPENWGDYTVLDLEKLSAEYQRRFAETYLGPSTLLPEQMGKALPEPHADWVAYLESGWKARH